MSYDVILFDLDGTLLPRDQSAFIKDYFGRLVRRIAPLGYAPDDIVNAIWAGSAAMVKNDGQRTNEEAFWDSFASVCGERIRKEEPHFAAFYREEFDEVRHSCGFLPEAASAVRSLKEMGLRVILATNPLFPSAATECRIRWAGLSLYIDSCTDNSFCLHLSNFRICNCKTKTSVSHHWVEFM